MASQQDWETIHPQYNVPMAVVLGESPLTLKFDVRRNGHNAPWTSVSVYQWVNSNYLLWAMLAGISEGNADPSWTEIFESRLRPLWSRVQSAVDQVDGPEVYKVYIRPPSVLSATISCYSNDSLLRIFVIQPVHPFIHSSYVNNSSSVDRIWNLYEFAYQSLSRSSRFLVDLDVMCFPSSESPSPPPPYRSPSVASSVFSMRSSQRGYPPLPSYYSLSPPPPSYSMFVHGTEAQSSNVLIGLLFGFIVFFFYIVGLFLIFDQ
jgi:hypothetical protein